MSNNSNKRIQEPSNTYKKSKERNTELAKQRTVLAYERTLNAWLRTGLTAVLAGLGIPQFITYVDSQNLLRLIGAILIFMGGILFIIGLWRYYKGFQRIQSKNMGFIPVWLLASIIFSLFSIAIFVFILLYRTI